MVESVYTIMQTNNSNLLSCSICGSHLEFFGKKGAILHTKCSGCGITSDSLIDKTVTKNKEIRVYYKNKPSDSMYP